MQLGVEVTAQVRARREVERLLVDAEAARRAAERAADRLARLHRVSLALARAGTPEALAEAVVREGVPAVGAVSGVVTRLSEDGREFIVLAAHGIPAAVVDRWARFPNRPPSPHAEALAARTPHFFATLEAYGARFPHEAAAMREAGVASCADLPLVVGGKPFGVLGLQFDEPQAFAPEDRALLVTVASQCAQALERARLFEAERDARQAADAAQREAEAANRTKGEFLAVMSHELRTPLNAIGGYAELMEMGIRGPVTERQREDLGRIQRSQRHLLGLVNEVLNYAKLGAGSVRYAEADVVVRDALAEAEALVAPQARAKGLALGVDACPGDLAVRADQEKLRQVLVNLLSNAVKFTDRGGRVRVACEEAPPSGGDGARVRIAVRDTGMGISADKLGAIFEPFVQVRADLTRTAEGTGLGLAISRDLARGMGGDLTVESTPGAGSTFTLTLPAA
jgi:signal transduction histidine kinase